jgi:hypothetical protein
MGFPGSWITRGFDRDMALEAAVFFTGDTVLTDGLDIVGETVFWGIARETGVFSFIFAGPWAAGFGAAAFFTGEAAFGAGVLDADRDAAGFTPGLTEVLTPSFDETEPGICAVFTEPEMAEGLAAARGAAEFFLPALFSIKIPLFHSKIL